MASIVLLFLFFLLASKADLAQQKVRVGVFYESLCPDSIRFIKNQLEPIYQYFSEFVQIDFIPFGKSKSLQTENLLEFTCQHGPDECSGNKIHSCALEEATTQAAKVKFVACQMNYGVDGSDLCSEEAGLPYDRILECYASEIGSSLQLEAESKTKSIAMSREMLSFVPTIVYNGIFDQVKQERSLFEFCKVLCEEIQTITTTPPVCGGI